MHFGVNCAENLQNVMLITSKVITYLSKCRNILVILRILTCQEISQNTLKKKKKRTERQVPGCLDILLICHISISLQFHLFKLLHCQHIPQKMVLLLEKLTQRLHN